MTAQPLPKANELIGEINSYLAKKRKPTEWQVKLLKKKADTLRGKISENIYYDVQGRAVFEAAGLNDDEAERLQNLAFSVIHKNNLYFSATKLNIARTCIHYQIYVDLPIEDIFEINSQLANVLVENTKNTFSDVILFEYESVDVFEESLAS